MHKILSIAFLSILTLAACAPQAGLPVAGTITQAPPDDAGLNLPASQNAQPVKIAGVSSSQQLAAAPARYAVDQNPETIWNTGAHAPQWIEIEFSENYQIEKILLRVSQYPQGETHHQVWAGLERGDYWLAADLRGETLDGDVITVELEDLPTARFLKIETIQSSSWVAWREIEVLGFPDEGEARAEDELSAQEKQTVQLEEPADIIFSNGDILTMDNERPTAQALAIRGKKILAVGSNDEMDRYRRTETVMIDLNGKTLMPGFIDTHAHLLLASGLPFLESQQIALNKGVTTISELYVDQASYDDLTAFADSGDLKMRVALYLNHNNACGEDMNGWYRKYPPSQDPEKLMRVTGVKLYADGGSCNIPAYSFDFPGLGMGDLYFSTDQLLSVFREIDDAGYQIAIHSLGDRSLDMVLDAYDALLTGGGNPQRHRIEHSAVVRPDQIGRFGGNNLVLSVLGAYPVCLLTDPVNPLKFVIPAEYQSWEWPWRDMMDANPQAVFAWQSDAPIFGISYFDPIKHLYGFVARADISEEGRMCRAPAGLYEGHVTTAEALRMMTIDAAYALFLDETVGSLEPGKYADMVMLSENPMLLPDEELYRLQVQMTIASGQTVYCDSAVSAMCP